MKVQISLQVSKARAILLLFLACSSLVSFAFEGEQDVLERHANRKSIAVKKLTDLHVQPCATPVHGLERVMNRFKSVVENSKRLFNDPEGVYSREEEALSLEVARIFSLEAFRKDLIQTLCKDTNLEKVSQMDLTSTGNPEAIACLKKIHQISRDGVKIFAEIFSRHEGKDKIISNFLRPGHHRILNEDFFGGAVTRIIKSEFSKEYFQKRYLKNMAEQFLQDLAPLGLQLSPSQKVELERDLAGATSLIGFNRAYVGKWASMKSDLDVKAYSIEDKMKQVLEKYLPKVKNSEKNAEQLKKAYERVISPSRPKDSILMRALLRNKSELERIDLDLEVDAFAVMDDARVDRGLNESKFVDDRAFWATVVHDHQHLAGSPTVGNHFIEKVKQDLARSPVGMKHEMLRRSHSSYLGAQSFKPTHSRVLQVIAELKKKKDHPPIGASVSAPSNKLTAEAEKHILNNSSKQNWHYNLKTDACRFHDHVKFLETTHYLSNFCMFFQREKDRLNPMNDDYEHISRDEFQEMSKDSRFREGYLELTRGFCEIKDFRKGNESLCPLLGDGRIFEANASAHSYVFFASVVEKLGVISDLVNPDKNKALLRQALKTK